MSSKFIEAFNKAKAKTAVKLDDKDLLIVDTIQEINERINKIEGFKSVATLTYLSGTKMAFNFEISFNHYRTRLTVNADKGEFIKSRPQFTLSSGFFGKDEKMDVDTQEGIESILEKISGFMGEQAAQADREQSLNDAMARRRLMDRAFN